MTVVHRHRRLRHLTSAATAIFALTSLALPAGTSAADPLSDARAKAAALHETVTRLQVQAEQATERFDAIEARLADLVARQRFAQIQADAARTALAAAEATVAERARALYMAGGTLGIYASVLAAQDPGRLLSGLHDVQVLSNADRHALAGVEQARLRVQGAAATVAELVERQTDLLAQAAEARQAVEAALQAQQDALDAATAQVRALEAALARQLEAASAAHAAQTLEAARAAALQAGYRPPAPSPAALAAIAAAETQLGKPYEYGGSGPDTWDCSGLTQFAYRAAGIALPRTAAEQYLAVPRKIPLGELIPGDLLFWATDPTDPQTIHHVAIYLGNDQMLAAPHTGTVVQIQPVYLDGYFGAVRPG
ncbi:MAG: C40 family peptidase [Acidothermus sp.]|nr:C40 family peptidase [Acidothermus sp.]MCL6537363.1 C40 family peptidase [Acidothermus sp.]